MDPGAKVTYNGVEVGKVATVDEVTVGDEPKAKITLDVDPKYIHLIPKNVDAAISATTVFGNKYISFTSPKDPTPATHHVVRRHRRDRRDHRVQHAVRDADVGVASRSTRSS